jgi:hypothetical protein
MVDAPDLRSPYPYFGGKRKVAPIIWKAFGPDIANFIDPFFGSNAVLLCRPGGPGKIETVNDLGRMVANFWRAIKADPWEVACWCDDPVNEAEMHARHRWLVSHLVEGSEFIKKMHEDEGYYDSKIAGYWVWGICAWIGGGWCVIPGGSGARRGKPRPNLNSGQGVHSHGKARNLEAASKPHLSSEQGVFKEQIPDLAVAARASEVGRGVHRPPEKLPALAVKADGACAGRGIHSEAAVDAYSPHLPSLGNDRGIHGLSAPKGTLLHTFNELSIPEAPPCFGWFLELAMRMKRVRVACGDWKRVLGDSVLGKGKNVGGRRPCAVMLDPPYSDELRDPYLYSDDDGAVSQRVREWALEHGDDPDLRIALCGYAGEHTMPASWTEYQWTGARGYAGKTNKNREQERIWFSKSCLPLEPEAQPTLW